MPPLNVLCFYKRPITLSKISGLQHKSNSTCVLLYINMPHLNWIDAVFQKILSGHQILITDRHTYARTGVTLNAPPPFFEWRGHKNIINILATKDMFSAFICCYCLLFSFIKNSWYFLRNRYCSSFFNSTCLILIGFT